MSKFITGKELETAVDKIIWDAEDALMIVSPYIKLDEHFKKLFRKHLNTPKLHITIIFGKNEGQVNKSFNKNDLEFFLQFPNISIIYVPNLHAKYYANETTGLVTSINLYDYSFVNNIEFGVLYENKLLSLSKSSDNDVWEACCEIRNSNEVVYVKRPMYEKKLFSKNYLSSKVLLDRTAELYAGKPLTKANKKLEDFEKELRHDSEYTDRPTRESSISQSTVQIQPKSKAEDNFKPGFCIRTGKKIPFNPKAPLSTDAYKSWIQYGNEEFRESYCHYSGEPSKGETCFRRPILRKNLNKA